GVYTWKPGGENHTWCQSAFKAAVDAGMDVCVSNTFTTRKEIEPYVSYAKEKGATVVVTTMTTSYGNIHSVPESTLKAMRERWEPYEGERFVGELAFGDSRPARANLTDDEIIARMDASPNVKKRSLDGTDGVVSYNYNAKAFYKDIWDDATIHARGLFVRDGKVVARSFDKFFRINENRRSSVDSIKSLLSRNDVSRVRLYHKYNGYLGVCSWNETTGGWFVASKSTNSGPFAETARKAISESGFFNAMSKVPASERNGYSFVFEIFDNVNDPHFVSENCGTGCRLIAVYRNDLHNDGLTEDEIWERFGSETGALFAVGITAPTEWEGLRSRIASFVNVQRGSEGVVVQIEFENGEIFRTKAKTAWYSFWKYVRGKIFGSDRTEDHPSIPIYPGKPEEFIEPRKWMDVAIGIVNSMKWSEIDALKTPDMFGNPRLNMQKLIGIVEKRLVLERVEF
ncbi:MAG: T4 RnlA family RNA ligase, partial [Bacteroidales bacterium]|nr:T4 RnlA family RNA ligase [Bacteroidales bacterium]